MKTIVSSELGINKNDLTSKSRKQNLVFARMIFSCICNNHFKITQQRIADYLNQTQPIVNYYLKNIVNEINNNEAFLYDYQRILLKIEQVEQRKKQKEERDNKLSLQKK
ncbi:helix-turn-helix domain-containing protein [Chryseobacterium defluvii]|uniref:helix-turn-helix domain-containing protein n=1 Tax=Chryseobacterium defluvii TaxID=160396 RepID=UPI001474D192|nr:helix-turn-helix domain-containing protein [Chryseobacterium defluvii]